MDLILGGKLKGKRTSISVLENSNESTLYSVSRCPLGVLCKEDKRSQKALT